MFCTCSTAVNLLTSQPNRSNFLQCFYTVLNSYFMEQFRFHSFSLHTCTTLSSATSKYGTVLERMGCLKERTNIPSLSPVSTQSSLLSLNQHMPFHLWLHINCSESIVYNYSFFHWNNFIRMLRKKFPNRESLLMYCS